MTSKLNDLCYIHIENILKDFYLEHNCKLSLVFNEVQITVEYPLAPANQIE